MKQILSLALLLLLCIVVFKNEMLVSKNKSSLQTGKIVSITNTTPKQSLPSTQKRTSEQIGMSQLLFMNFPE